MSRLCRHRSAIGRLAKSLTSDFPTSISVAAHSDSKVVHFCTRSHLPDRQAYRSSCIHDVQRLSELSPGQAVHIHGSPKARQQPLSDRARLLVLRARQLCLDPLLCFGAHQQPQRSLQTAACCREDSQRSCADGNISGADWGPGSQQLSKSLQRLLLEAYNLLQQGKVEQAEQLVSDGENAAAAQLQLWLLASQVLLLLSFSFGFRRSKYFGHKAEITSSACGCELRLTAPPWLAGLQTQFTSACSYHS